MKYLKVFTDFLEVTEGLGDAGMGRLFRAMLRYAQDGTEPRLRGKEAVAWAVARQSIDREVHTYKAKVASAETARTCLKQKQSDKKALISEQDKDNNKNNGNDKYKDKDSLCRRRRGAGEEREEALPGGGDLLLSTGGDRNGRGVLL